jgi:hypothetical protein
MSRRLRSPSVVALLDALERRVVAPKEPGLFWVIDGKPLPIGGCSKDRQAGYGRAAGGKAKGYKLHAVISAGGIAAWRIAPMSKDERVMAARLLRAAPVQGYLVADSNYDSNPLHAACDRLGELQLITRGGTGRATAWGGTGTAPAGCAPWSGSRTRTRSSPRGYSTTARRSSGPSATWSTGAGG